MGPNTLTEPKQNKKKVVECSTVTWQVFLLLNGGGMPNQHELIKYHTESLLCFSGRDLDLTFQTRMRHLVIARWHSARFFFFSSSHGNQDRPCFNGYSTHDDRWLPLK